MKSMFTKNDVDDNFMKFGNKLVYNKNIRPGVRIHESLAEIRIRNNRYQWFTKKSKIHKNWMSNRQGHCDSVLDAKKEILKSWR